MIEIKEFLIHTLTVCKSTNFCKGSGKFVKCLFLRIYFTFDPVVTPPAQNKSPLIDSNGRQMQ